jgi:hypothetical protein
MEGTVTNVVQLRSNPRRKEPHPADDLSFMKRRKPRGTGIDYWVVETTGDYGSDCQKGRVLADEYLEYIGEHPTYGNLTLLHDIVGDMLKALRPDGRLPGTAIGFLSAVNAAATLSAVLMPQAVKKAVQS